MIRRGFRRLPVPVRYALSVDAPGRRTRAHRAQRWTGVPPMSHAGPPRAPARRRPAAFTRARVAAA